MAVSIMPMADSAWKPRMSRMPQPPPPVPRSSVSGAAAPAPIRTRARAMKTVPARPSKAYTPLA